MGLSSQGRLSPGAKEGGQQGDKLGADESHATARHELLHALRFSAGLR